jgi:hypothetical protein
MCLFLPCLILYPALISQTKPNQTKPQKQDTKATKATYTADFQKHFV